MAFGLIPGVIQYFNGAVDIVYIRPITIDYTLCGSNDVTDFPVFVKMRDNSLSNKENGGHVNYRNGNDIRFYSDIALENQLSWEIISYDDVVGSLIAWVKVPTVSSTGDTTFYITYGDSNNSTYAGNAQNVWSNSYKRVYHLNEDYSDVFGYNGTTPNDAVTFTTAGKLSNAAQFFVTGNTVITAADTDLPSGSDKRTVSFWFNISSYAQNPAEPFRIILGYGTTGSFDNAFLIGPYYYSNNAITFSQWGAALSTDPVNLNQWYHFTMMTDINGAVTLYLNGQFVTSSVMAINTILDGTFYLGQHLDSEPDTAKYDGLLSHVTVSDVVRSDDWITTEYNNQNNPGTVDVDGFLKYGTETTL